MKILKLMLIGLCTTVVRIIGQMLIPVGSQDVLVPSVFVQNNTMPIAFTIYGLFTYSVIAALFLIIKDQIGGHRVTQGLKYGLSCCIVWIVYLLEPLPHVAFIDKFTYPLADGVALLVMGLLCGVLLGDSKLKSQLKTSISLSAIGIITTAFVMGRLLQYTIANSYSLWKDSPIETMIWCIFTGIGLSCVVQWYSNLILCESKIIRALIGGGLLFGVNLFLFNFFMPLVFKADIPDLILRTVVDVLTVIVGIIFFLLYKTPKTNNH